MADLPDTVEEIIAARIDLLPDTQRSLLRLASVLGARFPGRVLERLVRADGRAAVAGLDGLDGFLMTDDTGLVRFEHALVREAAYEGLPYRRRERLHALAGELLERHSRYPDDAAEELSRHFSVARRYEAAWRYSLVAAARARHNAAPVEAAAFLRRALEAGTKVAPVTNDQLAEVWTQLGDVCEFSGQYEQAEIAYGQARRRRRGDVLATVDLYRKEGRLRERSRRYSSALRWYGKGFRLLDELSADQRASDLARGQLLVTYGAARNRQGHMRQALPYLFEAVELATKTGDKPTLAHAYYLLDWALTALGDPRRFEYRPLALPIYEELGDMSGQANVLNNLSINCWQEGKWSEALEYGRRFRQACEKAGDMVQVGTAASNRGELLFEKGEYAEAEELFREARSTWRSFQFPVGIALATGNLGRLLAHKGELEESAALLADARAQFVEIGADNFVLDTDGREVERLLLAGEPEAAQTLAELAHRGVSSLGGMPLMLSWLERLWGSALAQQGDWPGARAKFERSLARSTESGAEFEMAMTWDALGAPRSAERRWRGWRGSALRRAERGGVRPLGRVPPANCSAGPGTKRVRPRALLSLLAATAMAAVPAGCSGHRGRPGPRAAAPSTMATVVCTSRPDQAGSPPEFLITAVDTAYDRTCVQTIAGRVVLVFNNRDAGVGHSLTVIDPAGQQVINSGVLVGPRVFSLSFQVTAGTYRYHCVVHPQKMNGVLIVK